MYPFEPRAIYVTDDVLDDARCVTRLETMLAAMGRDDYQRVDHADLARIAHGQGWTDPRHKGEIRNERAAGAPAKAEAG